MYYYVTKLMNEPRLYPRRMIETDLDILQQANNEVCMYGCPYGCRRMCAQGCSPRRCRGACPYRNTIGCMNCPYRNQLVKRYNDVKDKYIRNKPRISYGDRNLIETYLYKIQSMM
jgi:hypothetical protein